VLTTSSSLLLLVKVKFHDTGLTRLCQRPGCATRSPTKSGLVCLGFKQVCRLCLVVDLSNQSKHIRFLSMGLVGSQTKSAEFVWVCVMELKK